MLLLLLVAAAAPVPADSAEILLRPVAEDGAVAAIDVEEILNGGDPALKLDAPIVYPGAPGAADRMQDVRVTDAAGAVPMTTTDDAAVPGGFPYFRHWQASRPVAYPVRIRYRALVQPPGGPGGPPFGIRAVGGGVVGSGSSFLLFPPDSRIKRTRLSWDLGALPNAIAASSYGEGDVIVAQPPAELTQAWYLAGPAGRFPAKGAVDGFSAYWLGTPTFDAPAEMAWTARAHAYLAHYFPNLRPTQPYRVFMQFRDAPPFGGGTALPHSFMLSRGPLKPGEPRVAPRLTLFHEMIHQWVGFIDAPQGESSWYSEGLTSYYQDLLPLKGGFITLDEYEAAINRLAEDYFTSKARNWSAAEITKVGFGDEEVRHTPYRRSALYFADLDARIRAHSGGKRSLDSLLFPMFMAREKGMKFDTAKWEAMVVAELGPVEKERFERLILQGSDTLEPRADTFGPCFERKATMFAKDGKEIPGFIWVRVTGVPDATCRKR
jgi:hypothetical protein